MTGQKARLISRTFSGSNKSSCFILSYSMYGSSMGALRIYLENSQGRSVMLSKDGDQGQSWHTVHLELLSYGDYKVRRMYI